jgi:2'-5' RNA ligase
MSYHVGIRLHGYAKDFIKALTCEISKNFNLGNLEKRIVPHMTLIRPFTTENEIELVDSFEETLSAYKNPLFYTLKGFDVFENNEKVIYSRVEKNPEIEKIISGLEKSFGNNIHYANEKINLPSDENEINLHCSIIDKNANAYLDYIKNFVSQQKFPEQVQPVFRIYLLKNNFILREYDFYLKKSLERFDAINPFVFKETLSKFREKTDMDFSDGVLLPFPKKF